MNEEDIKLNIVNATELKKDRYYVLAFDRGKLSRYAAQRLIEELSRRGIKSTAVGLFGGPDEALRIIDLTETKKNIL